MRSLLYYIQFTTHSTMGTCSRIGYELPDHTVVSVYCHYDGYVEHNGKILVEHYQNREDVVELIGGGSMSSLRTTHTWETKAKLDENDEFITDSNGNLIYENIRDPQPLYYSERGEVNEPDVTDFDKFISGHWGEKYAYLYDLNGNWKAYKIGWGDTNTERVEIPGYVVAA